MEVGDHGTLERRNSGCALGALGLRTHLSEIRSHEKLTGEGMTFACIRLIPLLDETLPARFGGAGIDYQVVEEEDSTGLLRLYLLVSPRVGPVDELEVKRIFLAELGGRGEPERYMAAIWALAGTVQVRRQVPIATPAGKIQPFHGGRRLAQPGDELTAPRGE